MCASYAVVINLYYVLSDRKVRIWDILVIPSIAVLAVSGSRKALVVCVAGVFGVFILKNWNGKKALKSFLKVSLVIIVLTALVFTVSRLPAFRGINARMMELITILFKNNYTRSNSAWIRMEYNKLGMRLFRSSPVLGIGIGSANYYTKRMYGHDHFLHNNYIEMLACGGIVGFIIYYSVYLVILGRLFRYRRFRDREYDICLILLLIVMVMDYGKVSYLEKNTYVFLMLFWAETEILKRRARGDFRLQELVSFKTCKS